MREKGEKGEVEEEEVREDVEKGTGSEEGWGDR
jgi:hypothetical protein